MRLDARRAWCVLVVAHRRCGRAYLLLVAGHRLTNICRRYRGGPPSCACGGWLGLAGGRGDWRSLASGCCSSTGVAWVELVLAGAGHAGSGLLAGAGALRAGARHGRHRRAARPARAWATPASDRARDETGRLAEAIDAMLDRVAEGYEAQRRFAANASHELRTPLATQRALIEVGMAAALTGEQLELLTRQLLATNERNERLIEGLLVLGRDRTGPASSRRRSGWTRSSTTTLTDAGQGRRRDGVHVAAELAPPGRAASGRCSSGWSATWSRTRSSTTGRRAACTSRVSRTGPLVVSNTGPDVAPEQVPGLFEPFRRQSGDRLDHGGGAGLGLTIARSIVAAHHGRIGAVANPGGGLTVDVTLATR